MEQKPALSMRTVVARQLWLMHLPSVPGWDARTWLRVLMRTAPYESDVVRCCGTFEHETGGRIVWEKCDQDGKATGETVTTNDVRQLLETHWALLLKKFKRDREMRAEAVRRRRAA